jgi:predicted signal transduction protein with EAL and GGDEF domain
MLRVADHWYDTRKLTNELTLIYEPHVHPFLRCNIWHLRGRDKDLLVDTGLGVSSLKNAIDDFGTGYSSLSYLQQFPINTLKIDKSFVSSINESEEATSIVDAIVAMAKGLKLNLIAEGVETDPQLEYLKNLGCESIQGYLFGKAEGGERTTEILNCIEQGDLVRNLTAV